VIDSTHCRKPHLMTAGKKMRVAEIDHGAIDRAAPEERSGWL
jgi:hypothetical protein